MAQSKSRHQASWESPIKHGNCCLMFAQANSTQFAWAVLQRRQTVQCLNAQVATVDHRVIDAIVPDAWFHLSRQGDMMAPAGVSPTWGTATVNARGPWGMHAPSRFSSLHRTPGPLLLPPCHLHLKGGWPRRLPLCSPFLTPEMIWFISSPTEIYAFRRATQRLSSPANEDGGQKEGLVILHVIPGPNGPLVTVLDSFDAGDFLSLSPLPGSVCWGTGEAVDVFGREFVGGEITVSNSACVPDVSDSHVWWSMTSWLRSD